MTSLWTAADPTSFPARPSCIIVFINYVVQLQRRPPSNQFVRNDLVSQMVWQIHLWFGPELISLAELFQIRGLQTMSYDSNSSLDRALELAKKRWGETHTTQTTLANDNLILRAMQFSYAESEDGGGSTAKRHLGSGPEIHLKLLIPRFTETIKLHICMLYSFAIKKIYDVIISAMLLGMS